MPNLYNVPSQNNIQRTLANTLNAGETLTITFSTSVSAVLQASATIPGILVIDRVDVNGTATPSLTEYISFTGVSGSTVTGLTRGIAGTSDIAHSIGAIVEFVPDVTWADAINDVFTTQHNADGTHKNLAGVSLASLSLLTSNIDTFSFKNINAPEGFLVNGKIIPSVASNNLTVALKTLAGTDASATDPIYVRIGDTVRTITSALSLTRNAGTNWFNSGSAELATREIDYFVYIGFNATDGVTLGFSRIPYARLYSDFNTTTTNERHCAISTITNAAAGDNYVNVGRFAATLSASASFNWSVPTFTNVNLIQAPIYETRRLEFSSVTSASGSMTFTSVASVKFYKIVGNIVNYLTRETGTTGGSASTEIKFNLPFINNLAGNQIAVGTSWQSGNNGRAELILTTTSRTVLIFRGSDTGIVNWGIGADNGLLDSVFWYFID